MNERAFTELVPEHMRGAMHRYISQGIEPGSFLESVLRNNLKEAFGHADSINKEKLEDILTYLYTYAPAMCWGSDFKYEAWVELHRQTRDKSVSDE